VLRTSEDKPDAVKRHKAALERITDIMTSEHLPYDSKDLCVPLLKELLVLTDHFQMEVNLIC